MEQRQRGHAGHLVAELPDVGLREAINAASRTFNDALKRSSVYMGTGIVIAMIFMAGNALVDSFAHTIPRDSVLSGAVRSSLITLAKLLDHLSVGFFVSSIAVVFYEWGSHAKHALDLSLQLGQLLRAEGEDRIRLGMQATFAGRDALQAQHEKFIAASQSSAIHYNNPEGLEAKDARLLRNAIDLIPDRLRIRTRTVQKILQQLREIHGQAVPEPVAGIYMDWNEPPFRAGWHTWIVGTDPDSHSQKIANFGHGLHFCGEAWSRDQGWIEGALKTAERVLAGSPFQAKPTKTAKLYVDMNFATYIGGNDTHEDGVKPAEATP
jgi:hypothetical protein